MSRYERILLKSEGVKDSEQLSNTNSDDWSVIMNNHLNLPTKIHQYLRTMQEVGVVPVKNDRGEYTFRPGKGLGWEYDDEGNPLDAEKICRDIVAILYTYLVTVPAQQEGSPAFPAFKAAIEAGASILPGPNGLRFYWDRAGDDEEGRRKVAEARKMLDSVQGEAMKWIKKATEDARKLGIAVISGDNENI